MPVSQVTVTELDEIKPSRVDQVKSPASGVPVLIMKALNPQGGVDEAPDIDGAEHILQLLAKLIQSEASEMAAGSWDESCDIQLLGEIASLVKCFRDREMWNMGDDGDVAKELEDFTKEVEEHFIKAHRKFSAADRKRLAQEGNALNDGSYPIPDADALRRAAILARSGHGDVTAARRLIAKRAKELGVSNPLKGSDAEKDMTDTEKSVPTQHDGGVNDGHDETHQDRDATTEKPGKKKKKGSGSANGTDSTGAGASVSKEDVIKAAVTEAITPLVKDVEVLKGDMARVLGMPVPGGPVMTAPPAARKVRERETLLAKAARADRLAESVTEQDMKAHYRAEAAQARADAAAL